MQSSNVISSYHQIVLQRNLSIPSEISSYKQNCRKMTTCQRLCQNKTHRCKRDGRNDIHLTCELNCRKRKKKEN